MSTDEDQATLRRNLILTIGVLWAAALVIIVVSTIASAETTYETRSTPPSPAEVREYERCQAENPGRPCLRPFPGATVRTGESTRSFDVSNAVQQSVAFTAIALVLAAMAVVWIRPSDRDQGPIVEGAPIDPIDVGVSTESASAVVALRDLKALHDEGILTDAEYESKRKALADEL